MATVNQTVFFLNYDDSEHEYSILRQTYGQPPEVTSGWWHERKIAAAQLESRAQAFAKKHGGTAVYTVIPDWANAPADREFQARSCWLIE